MKEAKALNLDRNNDNNLLREKTNTDLISRAIGLEGLKRIIGQIGYFSDGEGAIYEILAINKRIDLLSECLKATGERDQQKIESILQEIPEVCGIREKARDIVADTTMY